jgi:hypothetical protein
MTIIRPALSICVEGRSFGLTVSTVEAGELYGVSDDTMCRLCEQGVIPTLPRRGKGSSWRIPTGRLLDTLGIAYEVIAA